MGFAPTTEWEVRTTGNDANGGGFERIKTANGGIDYSQQDLPQITFTDMVIGTNTTQFTSVLNPVTDAMVGNIINITGGTGFTIQRAQISSQSGGVASCERSLGVANSTGGQGNLGGALATPGLASGLITEGNVVHIKAGTYTLSDTRNGSGGRVEPNTGNHVVFIGYQTTRRDMGTKPIFVKATGGGTAFVSAGILINLIIDGNTTGNSGIWSSTCIKCETKRFTNYGFGSSSCAGCSSHNNGSHGFSSNCTCICCESYDNTGSGNGFDGGNHVRCTAYRNNHGFSLSGYKAMNCVAYGNRSNGFESYGNGSLAINCISYGNAGNGFYGNNYNDFAVLLNCAYGANTTANLSANIVSYTLSLNGVLLSANPFTSVSTTTGVACDFSLNATAGGGAACKDAGFQWGS